MVKFQPKKILIGHADWSRSSWENFNNGNFNRPCRVNQILLGEFQLEENFIDQTEWSISSWEKSKGRNPSMVKFIGNGKREIPNGRNQ